MLLVPVHRSVWIADDPAPHQRHHLVDPVRDRAVGSESKLRLDLLEADAIVPRVLIFVDEVDSCRWDTLLEKLDDFALAVVLSRIADVEHVAGDCLDRTLDGEYDSLRGVAYVRVRPPELLPENDQISAEADVPRELVDRQVEPHARRRAVDGGEAEAACRR